MCIYISMTIELCDEFFFRVTNKDFNLWDEFNTSRENVLRNNNKLKLYAGEWVKVKVNDYNRLYCYLNEDFIRINSPQWEETVNE